MKRFSILCLVFTAFALLISCENKPTPTASTPNANEVIGQFIDSRVDVAVGVPEQHYYSIKDEATGKYIGLDFTTPPSGLNTGDRVKVSGTLVKGQYSDRFKVVTIDLVSRAKIAPFPPALSKTAAAPTLKLLKLLVIVVNLKDTVACNSVNEMRQKLYDGSTNCDQAYRTYSYGQLGLQSGPVEGVTFDKTRADYANSGNQLMYDGIGYLQNTLHYNTADYNQVLVIAPGGIPGAGIAFNAGSNNCFYGAMQGCIIHEIGHGIGVYSHSSCAWNNQGKDDPTYEWYGDFSCIMGYGSNNNQYWDYNIERKILLGWLDAFPAAQAVASSSGSYTLLPPGVSPAVSPGLRVVRIPAQDNSTYFISFRQPHFPYDSAGRGLGNQESAALPYNALYDNTVTIYRTYPDGVYDCYIVASLKSGKTFTDSKNNIAVTCNSVNTSSDLHYANIQVNLGNSGGGGGGSGTGTGTGLAAQYFSDMNLTTLATSRVDATVNFDWGNGSPDGAVPSENFSARWSGQVQAQYSETYTFYTNSDDGIRLWVNGTQIINNWTDHGPTENSGTISLTAGSKYDIKLEYYENSGGAVAQLSWASPSTAKQIIPQSQLFPATVSGGGSGTGTGTGLAAQYFSDMNLSNLATSRVDATVNFDWGNGSPDGAVPSDNFSARWSGQVQAQYSQTYTFYTNSDDGIRLWVNGTQIINNWTDHGPTENSGTIALTAGQKYAITLEYYENSGGAVAQLLWSSPSTSKQVVPQSQLFPATVSGGTGTGLAAQYFSDMTLTTLATSRVDPTVNFDWGNGSPDGAVPSDNFSARWSGQVQAQYSQTYTFYTNSDDGIRLWVNGTQVINNWTDHGPTENSGTIALTAGSKYDIKLEYYENSGGAVAQLSWASPSTTKQVIPQSQLFPATVSAPTNLAFNKTATQSSTGYGGVASRANDGNPDGKFSDNSVSHTNSDAQAWWQVDLGSVKTINSVNVWNRTDCCGDRVSNFDVKISSDGVTWTTNLYLAGQCGTPSTFNFGSVTGRYVRVQLRGTNFLNLAEVKVFGN